MYQCTHIHHGHGYGSCQAAVPDSTPETYGVSTSGSSECEQDVDEQSDFKQYNVCEN